MAAAPCDAHGQTVRGKLNTLYPALLRDGRRYQNKRKLCPDCTHEVLVLHKADWLDTAIADPHADITSCGNCGSEVGSNGALSRFFCTAYVEGGQRRDYAAFYCSSCAQCVLEEFELHA